MSGFYDCWDLGGLDTTLNSYLAGIRAPKQPVDIAPPPAPVVSAPTQPAPTQPSSSAFTNYTQPPPPAFNNYTQPPSAFNNYTPPQTCVKKQKPEVVELILRAMLSPIACIFLWMLCVVLATALLSRKKRKKRKYRHVPYDMRGLYRHAIRDRDVEL